MIETLAECLLVGFFATWFIVSVLVLVPRLNVRIRMSDWFALVPEWKFFAPEPGRWDYYLVYRDQLMDGSVTEWTEAIVAGSRTKWNAFWNPTKRGRKALLDATNELAAHIRVEDRGIEASVPYLTLLNHVSALPRPAASEFTQFVIVRFHATNSPEQPDVIFTSSLHAL
jgi:hypothetical protein